MKRNIGSVLIVIVGVILAVDVVARLAPQEAVAQEDAAAIAKAIKQQALQQERLIYEAAAARTATPTRTTTPSIFTRAAWATDLEIVGNSYYILWSDGSVTNGGTLP